MIYLSSDHYAVPDRSYLMTDKDHIYAWNTIGPPSEMERIRMASTKKLEQRGVAFNPPPSSIMQSAQDVINDTFRQLPSEANGAVVALATDKGWNAVVAHRVGDRVQVVEWIGKDWGAGLTGGAAVRVTW